MNEGTRAFENVSGKSHPSLCMKCNIKRRAYFGKPTPSGWSFRGTFSHKLWIAPGREMDSVERSVVNRTLELPVDRTRPDVADSMNYRQRNISGDRASHEFGASRAAHQVHIGLLVVLGHHCAEDFVLSSRYLLFRSPATTSFAPQNSITATFTSTSSTSPNAQLSLSSWATECTTYYVVIRTPNDVGDQLRPRGLCLSGLRRGRSSRLDHRHFGLMEVGSPSPSLGTSGRGCHHPPIS